ncbi:hypothetical protein [Deinococcus sp. SL84]|uniref:hypothetical protein n=1 Tax=Deinococcus sp. SL84 TaxID=2994663 RepID=UPI00227409AE|nr:hypothetical protein [Deinococcus sp. SL84]MCY1702397.1 hypothetical protein [Deinococcus sp. SL84]
MNSPNRKRLEIALVPLTLVVTAIAMVGEFPDWLESIFMGILAALSYLIGVTHSSRKHFDGTFSTFAKYISTKDWLYTIFNGLAFGLGTYGVENRINILGLGLAIALYLAPSITASFSNDDS